jgi:hypothetical protein
MDLNPALKLAEEDFKKTDIESICRRTGAVISGEQLTVRYLGHQYSFSIPDVRWNQEVPIRKKIIILHYLARSKGTVPAGNLIDFRDIPGGNLYYPVFEQRIHRRFLKRFGQDACSLYRSARILDGDREDISGCAAVVIRAFPRIPVHFVLYQGDDEVPSACKVLFDASITDYLSTEDIVVLCEDTVNELVLKAEK